MQDICALLSGNTVAYKLWKHNSSSFPGQVIQRENFNVQDLVDILETEDRVDDTYNLSLALAHADFILKPIEVDDENLLSAFKTKNILWRDKSIRIDTLEKLKMKCAYHVEDKTMSYLETSGIKWSVTHYVPILLQGISTEENIGNNLYCAVSDGWVTLIYLIDNKIKYVNAFEIHFPQDLLYHMRLVAGNDLPDLNKTSVKFLGRVHEEGEMVKLIKPYAYSVGFVGENESHLFKDLIWLKECV